MADKKNPFERGFSKPAKPENIKAPPRQTAMALSTGQEGVDVNSHNQAPNDYTKRLPQPEAERDTPGVIKPPAAKMQQATVTGEVKNPFEETQGRRAAGLLTAGSEFEVVDNNAKKGGYVEKFKEEYEPPAGKPVVTRKKLNADNYMKAYRQKQANEKVDIEKQERVKKKKEVLEEKKKIETYILRSRQLRNEIGAWQAKLGLNPGEDPGIQSAINRLQLELSQIPNAYWS